MSTKKPTDPVKSSMVLDFITRLRTLHADMRAVNKKFGPLLSETHFTRLIDVENQLKRKL